MSISQREQLEIEKEDYRQAARIAWQKGHLKEARDYWVTVRCLSGGDQEASYQIAQIDESSGRFDEALKELVLCIQSYPRDEKASLMAARIYAHKHCLREAGWHYERTLELVQMHPEALEEYADLLLHSGDVREALKLLERLRNLHRDDVNVLLKMADCRLRLKDSRRAIEQLKNAYRMDPTNLDLRLKLAEVYLSESMHQQAIKLLMPLEEGGSIPARKLSILADCQIGLSKYDEAEKLIASYEELYPEDAEGARCRARLYARLGLEEEEELALLKVLELDPVWTSVQAMIDFLNEREDYDRLENFLTEQLDSFPEDPALFEELARLYKSDAPAEALDWLEKALKIRVRKESSILKGELLIKLNRYTQASQWFDSIKESWPDEDLDLKVQRLIEQDRRYKETLGLSQKAREALEANSWRKALYYYKEMVQRVPDNPDWLEQLGNLHSFETSYAEAMDAFERACEFVRPAERDRLGEKMFTLAYLHNDFERAMEVLGALGPEIQNQPEHRLRVLKVERHLLAGKLREPSHFEHLLESVSTRSADGLPLGRLLCGFAHLHIGSHLLDSGVWVGTATEMFVGLIEDPVAEVLHSFAFEGLYMVFLMDGNHERILPLLENWMKRHPGIGVRRLYLQELQEEGQYRDAVRTLERWLDETPESLELRELKLKLAWKEMKDSGRAKHSRYLVARLKENCQREGTWLQYYDLALGLRITTESKPTEEAFQHMQNALKKAVRLAGEQSGLSLAMLRTLEYGERLHARDSKMSFTRRRVFLEKELSHIPDDAGLLLEYGRLLLEDRAEESQGERLLIKALTLKPDLDLANSLLGDYHFRKKDYRRAWHYWLKIIEKPISRQDWSEIVDKMQRML